MVTIGQLGVDLYLPSLPHIAKSLGSIPSMIKLTLPVYLLGMGVSQIICGPVADATGRKPILYLGFSIFILCSIGCFFSLNARWLLIFRFFQGTGVGGIIINVRAVMRDFFHGKKMARASSIIFGIWTLTPLVAPVVGGYIQDFFGWRANFFALFLIAFIVGTFVYWLLPESLDHEHKKTLHPIEVSKNYIKLFSDKVFVSFSMLSALCYTYFICYVTVSPFLFQNDLGLSPVIYGWLVLLIAFGIGTGSWICTHLVSTVKIIHVILTGIIIMVTATVSMVIWAVLAQLSIALLLIPPFLGSIGAGLIFPNCTTGALTHYKRKAATAGAALGFMQMIIGFVFSIILSHLPTSSALPLSIMLSILSLLICLLFFWAIKAHFIEELEE